MKVKELKRTVNVCWSPADHYPVTIAAGSAAQQVDSSFSSSSYLELYSLNLEDPGLDLELKSSLQTEHKWVNTNDISRIKGLVIHTHLVEVHLALIMLIMSELGIFMLHSTPAYVWCPVTLIKLWK